MSLPERGREERISRLLSLLLRHAPGRFGVAVDSSGWAAIEAVIEGLASQGLAMDQDDLLSIVQGNDKRRFEVSDDGLEIRARHGHSLAVDLGMEPADPPDVLYHGTNGRFLDAVLSKGLLRGSRQYVHLSSTVEAAVAVGSRRGEPVVLCVDTRSLTSGGHRWYEAGEGIWLTTHVPPDAISVMGRHG